MSASPDVVAAAVAQVEQGKNRRVRISLRRRWQMLRDARFRCRYCGRPAPEVILEIDHILPISAGGTNDPANLVVACRTCNNGKSASPMPDLEWQPVWSPPGELTAGRCADERHAGPFVEGTYADLAPHAFLACRTCGCIVATRRIGS